MKVKRLTGAEIARHASGLPQTVEPPPGRPPADKLVQINFKATAGLARILGQMAAQEGSVRVVIARLLRADGRDVPEADLRGPPARKWQ